MHLTAILRSASCRSGLTPAFADTSAGRQIIRVMKLTAILLTAACLQVAASGKSQTVTLDLKNAPVQKVFKEVSRQTGVSIVYAESLFRDMKPVTIQVKDATVKDVLDECLKGQPFEYTLKGNSIVIGPAPTAVFQPAGNLPNEPTTAEPVVIPPIDIKGRITNEDGEPVVASIIVKGTQQGTTSNPDGYFELKGVDENATLIITGVSVETIEVKVNGKSDLGNITTKTKVAEGDEVLINAGYYKTTNKLRTGNISRVDAKTISHQPVLNPLQAIQGRMAGVYVKQSTGVPGGGLTIQIRGRNSLRDDGNAPLYIIDGVPFTSTPLTSGEVSSSIIAEGSALSSISPSDIESIEILKDADATAIYGSRGSNGVVLITTKKAGLGKTKLNFAFQQGWGKVTKKMDLLETPEYVNMRVEALKNSGSWPLPPPAYSFYYDLFFWDTTRNTNWQKELIGGTALTTNARFGISSGNENTQFLLSGDYYRESTVFPGDGRFQRATGNFNMNHLSGNKKLRVQLLLNYSASLNNLMPVDLTGISISLPPNAPSLYNPDGSINWDWKNGFTQNPVSFLKKDYQNRNYNFISNVVLSYSFNENLSFKVSTGYTSGDVDELSTSPLGAIPPQFLSNQTGSSQFGKNSLKTWIAEPQVEFKSEIGKGVLSMLAGSTFQESERDGNVIIGRGYTSDALLDNIRAATKLEISSARYAMYRYAAIFTRINYNLQKKYILNLTARRDGSSRFGPGKRFGNFGSVGAAWIFSNEDFVRNNLKFLNFGKLRTSFGVTGSDAIGDYQYLNTYSPTSYPYGGTTGLVVTRLDNKDFSWESNRKFEVGLEFGLFNDKLQFSASYYRNRSSNQLVGLPLSVITGLSSVQFNLPAVVDNIGTELQLTAVNVSKGKFNWVTDLNLTIPKNKLVEFPGLEAFPAYRNLYKVGSSLYVKRVLKFTGVNSANGLYTFEDFNNDGNISSSNDGQFLKEISQKFFGGVHNSFRWGNIELNVFFQFVKQTGYNYLFLFGNPGSLSNQSTEVLARWTKPGDITNVQKYILTSAGTRNQINARFSDLAISDASFVRLKNLAVSWSLPTTIRKKMFVEDAKLSLSAQNLFTFTKYKGFDPENQAINYLPPLRNIAVGINITF